jgi:hypothetical protein
MIRDHWKTPYKLHLVSSPIEFKHPQMLYVIIVRVRHADET